MVGSCMEKLEVAIFLMKEGKSLKFSMVGL
jgi:hypothetical protein